VLGLVLCALLAPCAPRSAAEEPKPTHAETMVVTGSRSPQPLARVPASISVVLDEAIRRARPTIGLDESLNRVPGVFVQNSGNFAQDFRLQIRGFGTRAAFGIREVTLMVDGLPETLPDGQTQVDTLELASIQSIEVLRGPGAALYGNAAGGVIQISTVDPPETPGVDLRVLGGSFGLAKVVASAGAQGDTLGGIVTGSYFQVDGYRDHSAARAETLVGRLVWDVVDGTEIQLLVDAVDAPLADDPGGLTSEDANANPRAARELNVLLDAGESLRQARVGATSETIFDEGVLNAYAFLLYRDFQTLLPTPPELGDGFVEFDRLGPGAGVRWTWEEPILGWPQALTIGTDLQHQRDDRQRYANVLGTKGALGLDQIEKVTGGGVYAREVVSLGSSVEVSGALRYDAVHYAVDVEFPEDSGDSGTRLMDAWSPGGGIAYMPVDGLTFFGNVATAFQVPTTTELVNPVGPGFNPDIEPQTARSYEIGIRASVSLLDIGLSLYRIDLKDELVPFEIPGGRVAFRNAGESRRYGVELEWESELPWSLTWSGAVTALDAHYLQYTTDVGNFDGNREPGIPPYLVYQEILWGDATGFHAAIESYLVGGYFVDDANSASTPGYGLLNLRFGWVGEVGGWLVAPFVGLMNLTDARYDGTVRLNAIGGRYYEPAPGFNVFGGIELHPPS